MCVCVGGGGGGGVLQFPPELSSDYSQFSLNNAGNLQKNIFHIQYLTGGMGRGRGGGGAVNGGGYYNARISLDKSSLSKNLMVRVER